MSSSDQVPTKGEDGRWWVGDQSFDTNAAAWKWLDKVNEEAHSRIQAAHDWSFKMSANRQ